MRFQRVIFGNASSPFLLNATVRFHLSKFDQSATVKDLQKSLYVDNWLTGADTEDRILDMKREADDIMKRGGFTFAQWATNCNTVGDKFSKIFN